jgi:hypothetical protein
MSFGINLQYIQPEGRYLRERESARACPCDRHVRHSHHCACDMCGIFMINKHSNIYILRHMVSQPPSIQIEDLDSSIQTLFNIIFTSWIKI